jgi:hypothetical protein
LLETHSQMTSWQLHLMLYRCRIDLDHQWKITSFSKVHLTSLWLSLVVKSRTDACQNRHAMLCWSIFHPIIPWESITLIVLWTGQTCHGDIW